MYLIYYVFLGLTLWTGYVSKNKTKIFTVFTRVKLVRKQPIGSMSLRQLADRTLRQRNEHKWKRLCNPTRQTLRAAWTVFTHPYLRLHPPTQS